MTIGGGRPSSVGGSWSGGWRGSWRIPTRMPRPARSTISLRRPMQVRWASSIDAQNRFDHPPHPIALGSEFDRLQGRGGVI